MNLLEHKACRWAARRIIRNTKPLESLRNNGNLQIGELLDLIYENTYFADRNSYFQIFHMNVLLNTQYMTCDFKNSNSHSTQIRKPCTQKPIIGHMISTINPFPVVSG